MGSILQSIHYMNLEDYFASSEKYSGLSSNHASDHHIDATLDPHSSFTNGRLNQIHRFRIVRRALMRLPIDTRLTLCAHYDERNYPTELKLSFEYDRDINVINLAMYLDGKIEGDKKKRWGQKDRALKILRQALKDFADTYRDEKRKFTAERQGYRQTSILKARGK